jgi:hypothetical protein
MNNVEAYERPTILGLADSTHYLVGIMDEQENFTSLSDHGDVVAFRTLYKAKEYLRELEYQEANVHFDTAYDEMCGLSESQPSIQRITL